MGELGTDGTVWLARVYRETVNAIAIYRRRVAEGQDLQPALDFARYVIWSGLVPLCKRYATDGQALKIDGSLLESLATELQRTVQERFSSGKSKPDVQLSQLEAINHKLDLIAGRLSRVQLPMNNSVNGENIVEVVPAQPLTSVYTVMPATIEAGAGSEASGTASSSSSRLY